MLTTTAALCLALNIYHEARGEPEKGQIAVGMVTMNRANWKTDQICQVVYQPQQFSWTTQHVASAKKEVAAWHRSQQLARQIIARRHSDPTQGATHFHTKNITPKWSACLQRTVRIGQHIFYASDL